LITAIGKKFLQEREHSEQCPENQHPAVAVLNVRRMHHGVEHKAYRINEDRSFLALDLLARVVAVRVNFGPPFSALFTLWLSITPAVGLASRPIFSRHLT